MSTLLQRCQRWLPAWKWTSRHPGQAWGRLDYLGLIIHSPGDGEGWTVGTPPGRAAIGSHEDLHANALRVLLA